MDDIAHADLDDDGEFDAIDISIMENEEPSNQSSGGKNAGCCVMLLAKSID